MLYFFFNDTATTEIYTLSLHDALPIYLVPHTTHGSLAVGALLALALKPARRPHGDRKSTRLNSSHANISYAVFCLKKKTLHLHHSFADSPPLLNPSLFPLLYASLAFLD